MHEFPPNFHVICEVRYTDCDNKNRYKNCDNSHRRQTTDGIEMIIAKYITKCPARSQLCCKY